MVFFLIIMLAGCLPSPFPKQGNYVSSSQNSLKNLKGLSIIAGGTLLGGAAIFSTTGAQAIQESCGGVSGASEVSTGICQISFLSVSEAQLFTAPSGVTKMGAVLVGGGGGAWVNNGNGMEAYGGGGGGVTYVNLDAAAGQNFKISVGSGGAPAEDYLDSGIGGGTTTLLNITTDLSVDASGGSGATDMKSGDSGEPGIGSGKWGYRGASGGGACADGAAMDAVDDYNQSVSGGAGCAASSLAGVDSSLFPASEIQPLLGSGGDASIDLTVLNQTLNGQVWFANTGAGGNAAGLNVPDSASSTANAGSDGGVYIRWQTVQEQPADTSGQLANTGSGTNAFAWGVAALSGLMGAALAFTARRRQS